MLAPLRRIVVLGITSIDPITYELLFERFVSGERREPPDLDGDVEHERRKEIIQWIYETHGRNHAALPAVVQAIARAAVRTVGKALGLPEDLTSSRAGLVSGWSAEGVGEKQVAELNLDRAVVGYTFARRPPRQRRGSLRGAELRWNDRRIAPALPCHPLARMPQGASGQNPAGADIPDCVVVSDNVDSRTELDRGEAGVLPLVS